MTLQKIEQDLIGLESAMAAEKNRHKTATEALGRQIAETERQKGLFIKGLDLEKIEMAESALAIRGMNRNFNEELTRSAIKGIASNDGCIYRRYYGVKNYSGWTHQREDHEYGQGPQHGEIVFSIGLRGNRDILTSGQIEACLYYLNVILNDGNRLAILGGQA